MPFLILLLLLVLPTVQRVNAQDVVQDAVTAGFLARFQAIPGGTGRAARLTFDGRPVLVLPVTRLSCAVEGGAQHPVLVVLGDGAEVVRVTLLQIGPQVRNLPPLAVPDVDALTVSSESRSVNGTSRAKVWLDGKTVYDGPGAHVQTVRSAAHGRRSVVVTVDGRPVYRIGESLESLPSNRDP